MSDGDTKGPLVTEDVLLRAQAWLDRLEKTTMKLDEIAQRLVAAEESKRRGGAND